MVKKSCFNFVYQRRKGETVIYNTFSKALVVLDEKEAKQYEMQQWDDAYVMEELKVNGILVETDFDEKAFLKYWHYKTKFSNDTLTLTIAPTLDCNFACPYCYENRRSGKMNSEIQEALIKFIENAIENGTKMLDISWYGGEPLLCKEIVESLSKRIRTLVEAKNCILKMHMVTNGYFLDKETIAMLDEAGITRIQVTLDGLKEHHDRSRPLRGGQGTFDKIMENLTLFEEFPIEVVVRMNVDNQNCGDFLALRKKIESLHNSNIELYPSPVEDLNEDTINELSDFMTTEEFESFAIDICEEGKLTAEDFSVMDDRYCFCTAETENCYVVDDLGDFYKCWDEVGRQEYKCFNIMDTENVNYKNIAAYVAADPFGDEKCKECVFLPLCFGGCKFQKAHTKKSVCGFTEESMKKYLEIAFFS